MTRVPSELLPAWAPADLASGWNAAAKDAQVSVSGLQEAAVALFAECAVAQVRSLRRGWSVLSRFAVAGTPDGFAAAVTDAEDAGREVMRDLSRISKLGAAVVMASMRPFTEFLPQAGDPTRGQG